MQIILLFSVASLLRNFFMQTRVHFPSWAAVVFPSPPAPPPPSPPRSHSARRTGLTRRWGWGPALQAAGQRPRRTGTLHPRQRAVREQLVLWDGPGGKLPLSASCRTETNCGVFPHGPVSNKEQVRSVTADSAVDASHRRDM